MFNYVFGDLKFDISNEKLFYLTPNIPEYILFSLFDKIITSMYNQSTFSSFQHKSMIRLILQHFSIYLKFIKIINSENLKVIIFNKTYHFTQTHSSPTFKKYNKN